MMRKGIKLSMKEVSNGEKEYEQGRYGESEMVICKLGGSSRHGWMGVVVFFCGEHEHLELGLGATRQEGWRDRHSVHVISGGAACRLGRFLRRRHRPTWMEYGALE